MYHRTKIRQFNHEEHEECRESVRGFTLVIATSLLFYKNCNYSVYRHFRYFWRLVGAGHARDSRCQPPNRGHGPLLQTIFAESLNSYQKFKPENPAKAFIIRNYSARSAKALSEGSCLLITF
jgi:hypothetical protein